MVVKRLDESMDVEQAAVDRAEERVGRWKDRYARKVEELRDVEKQVARGRVRRDDSGEIHEKYQRWLDRRDIEFERTKEWAQVLWNENERLKDEIRRRHRQGEGRGYNVRLVVPQNLVFGRAR